MNIIGSSMARGMFLVSPSGTPLARKAYGVQFFSAGTFTAITEAGDSINVTVAAGQTIPCVFTTISVAPASTHGYKVS